MATNLYDTVLRKINNGNMYVTLNIPLHWFSHIN